MTDGTEVAPLLPEARAALAAARGAAGRAGYRLLPAPDELRAALGAALLVYSALRAATDDHRGVRRLAAGREDLLCEPTRAILQLQQPGRGPASPAPRAVARLWQEAAQIQAAVRAALSASGADALLMPVAASGPIGFGAQVHVAGKLLGAAELMAHCRAVSLTGLPALSVPVAAGARAVQLVGADHGEDALCAVAAGLGAAA